MTSVIGFLASTQGRFARVIVGVGLILLGLVAVGGTVGIVVAVVGFARS